MIIRHYLAAAALLALASAAVAAEGASDAGKGRRTDGPDNNAVHATDAQVRMPEISRSATQLDGSMLGGGHVLSRGFGGPAFGTAGAGVASGVPHRAGNNDRTNVGQAGQNTGDIGPNGAKQAFNMVADGSVYSNPARDPHVRASEALSAELEGLAAEDRARAWTAEARGAATTAGPSAGSTDRPVPATDTPANDPEPFDYMGEWEIGAAARWLGTDGEDGSSSAPAHPAKGPRQGTLADLSEAAFDAFEQAFGRRPRGLADGYEAGQGQGQGNDGDSRDTGGHAQPWLGREYTHEVSVSPGGRPVGLPGQVQGPEGSTLTSYDPDLDDSADDNLGSSDGVPLEDPYDDYVMEEAVDDDDNVDGFRAGGHGGAAPELDLEKGMPPMVDDMPQFKPQILVRKLRLSEPAAAWHIPANVDVTDATTDEEVADIPVLMCGLDWAAYRASPSVYPFFDDLVSGSGCNKANDAGRPFHVTMGDLERWWYTEQGFSATMLRNEKIRNGTLPPPDETGPELDDMLARRYEPSGCSAMFEQHSTVAGTANSSSTGSSGSSSASPSLPPPWACGPAGVIFHQTRTGSTLMANMLGSLNHTVMLSEAQPPQAIVRARRLSFESKVRWLRVVIAAMARPIHAHARGLNAAPRQPSAVPVPGGDPQASWSPVATAAPATAGASGSDASSAPQPKQPELFPGWAPTAMYLKTQHTTVLWADVYRAAFPWMPWMFVHREPTEIMMSMLRSRYAPEANSSTLLDETGQPVLDSNGQPVFSGRYEHLPEDKPKQLNASTPCLRTRLWGPPPPAFLLQAARAHDPDYGFELDGLGDPANNTEGFTSGGHDNNETGMAGGYTLSLPFLPSASLADYKAIARATAANVHAESWCAIDLAHVAAAALKHALDARASAVKRAAWLAGAKATGGQAGLADMSSAGADSGTDTGMGELASVAAAYFSSPPPAFEYTGGPIPAEHTAVPAWAEAQADEDVNGNGAASGGFMATGSGSMHPIRIPATKAAVAAWAAGGSAIPAHTKLGMPTVLDLARTPSFTAVMMALAPEYVGTRHGYPVSLAFPSVALGGNSAGTGGAPTVGGTSNALGSGSILGVGLPTFLSYPELPGALPRLLDSHLASPGRQARLRAVVSDAQPWPAWVPSGATATAGQSVDGRPLPTVISSSGRAAMPVAGAAAWEQAALRHNPSLYRSNNITAMAEAALTQAASELFGQPTGSSSSSSNDGAGNAGLTPEEAAAGALKLFVASFMASSSANGGSGGSPATAARAASSFEWPAHVTPMDMVIMASQSGQYSKARATSEQIKAKADDKAANGANNNGTAASAGNGAATPSPVPTKKTGPRLPYANVDADGRFLQDDGVKQTAAWPALIAAGQRYMLPLHQAMLEFSGTAALFPPKVKKSSNGSSGSSGDAGGAVTLTTAQAAPRGVLTADEALVLLGGRSYALLQPVAVPTPAAAVKSSATAGQAASTTANLTGGVQAAVPPGFVAGQSIIDDRDTAATVTDGADAKIGRTEAEAYDHNAQPAPDRYVFRSGDGPTAPTGGSPTLAPSSSTGSPSGTSSTASPVDGHTLDRVTSRIAEALGVDIRSGSIGALYGRPADSDDRWGTLLQGSLVMNTVLIATAVAWLMIRSWCGRQGPRALRYHSRSSSGSTSSKGGVHEAAGGSGSGRATVTGTAATSGTTASCPEGDVRSCTGNASGSTSTSTGRSSGAGALPRPRAADTTTAPHQSASLDQRCGCCGTDSSNGTSSFNGCCDHHEDGASANGYTAGAVLASLGLTRSLSMTRTHERCNLRGMVDKTPACSPALSLASSAVSGADASTADGSATGSAAGGDEGSSDGRSSTSPPRASSGTRNNGGRFGAPAPGQAAGQDTAEAGGAPARAGIAVSQSRRPGAEQTSDNTFSGVKAGMKLPAGYRQPDSRGSAGSAGHQRRDHHDQAHGNSHGHARTAAGQHGRSTRSATGLPLSESSPSPTR